MHNVAVFTPQDFQSIFGHFTTLCIKRLKLVVEKYLFKKPLQIFYKIALLQLWTKYLRQTLVFMWLFRRFSLKLTNFHFGRKIVHWTIILRSFEIFLTFSNFLRSYFVSRSATRDVTRIMEVLKRRRNNSEKQPCFAN